MRVLKEILADGPQAAGNVKRQAATAGVAERTLDRARQALGVTTRRQGFGQGAFDVWAMPADPLEAMAQGTHGMDATCHDVVEGGAASVRVRPRRPREVHAMTARVARCDDCGNWFPVAAATG
jgi:hypothetical protein